MEYSFHFGFLWQQRGQILHGTLLTLELSAETMVLGLIVGHVPPPRLFAAGAIIGANQNVQDSLAMRGATTIYLARGIVPPGPGPQPAPQERRSLVGASGPSGRAGAGTPRIRY